MAKDSKTPFSNYKSAAVSGGATGRELGETRAWDRSDSYVTALGIASVSRPLACGALSSLITIWPKSKETY